MKKRIIISVILSLLVIGILAPEALAFSSYTTFAYTQPIPIVDAPTPDAYVPQALISSTNIGLANLANTPMNTPGCIYVDANQNVYIADSKNNRIIILNPDYTFNKMISTFTNDWGVPDALNNPSGLCVSNNNEIFVADTNNNRLVVFGVDGTFHRTINQPESNAFPEGSVYMPVAVAVDQYGRIFVVSSTTYQGIVAMDPQGNFQGFLGSQAAAISPWQRFWRLFQSAAQRAQLAQNVSTEYNNCAIDSQGFLFATTSSLDPAAQMSAAIGKGAANQPVKRLNPQGVDVMIRDDIYAPSGNPVPRISPSPMDPNMPYGAPKVTAVAVGPDGTWSIIDQLRQRIYTYDQNGYNLFNFGDIGLQFGNMTGLCSICYQGTNILALDNINNDFMVYRRTQYGDLLLQAIRDQNNLQYSQSIIDWEAVRQRNNNFKLASVNIGKSQYRDGEYQASMATLSAVQDVKNYSLAFKAYRKEWVANYIVVIPIVLIAVIIGYWLLFRYMNRRNARDTYKGDRKLNYWSHCVYVFHIIFRPFDGFWDMKHERRGSMPAAITVLAAACGSFIIKNSLAGYMFNPYGSMGVMPFYSTILSILVPVLLWVIANWGLTTLFDGEGSMRDIFMVTCYSTFPLTIVCIPWTLMTNFIVNDGTASSEAGLLNLLITVAWIWLAILLFFGTMTVHDYSLGKAVITSLATIVGMAFVMFVAVLFSAVVMQMYNFIYSLYTEISWRM